MYGGGMSAQVMSNPDVGARTVSSSVALAESKPVGVHPTFLVVEPGAGRAVAGFGDGAVKALSLTLEGALVSGVGTLDATPLSAATDVGGTGVLVGTDAGELLRIDGKNISPLASVAGSWIEHIAVNDAAGLRAYAARRAVVVTDAEGNEVFRGEDHPSTISGISFAPDGTRVAAAHYGGVTVWDTAGGGDAPVRLEWHGSHTAIGWSPCGTFIVTAMQDREMHCWRWGDKKGMRMSGYPSKIRSLSWTADGRYVAASGADTVTSWDCSGNGPSGKPPLEFGYVYNGIVMQVAAHPAERVVAGGYSDGSVMIGNIEQETAMIARPGGGAAIAGLAWSPDGRILVAADVDGALAVIRIKEALV